MSFLLSVPITAALLIAPFASPARADSAAGVQVISGPSPYASCSTPGGDTLYPNAETEPDIATNPATIGTDHVNLIAVWEQDKWQSVNDKGLVAAYSFDGGKTWGRSNLPFGQCATGSSPYDRVGEAWVSIGPDGTAYVAAGGTKPDANAIWVATSHDGGKTWGDVAMATENTALSKLYAFRPLVVADPTKPGTAYLTWNRNLGTNNGPLTIWFAKTVDGGKSWSQPAVLVNEPNWSAALSSPIQVDSHTGVLYEMYFRTVANTVKKKICHTVKAKKKGSTKKKGSKKKVCSTRSVVPANPTFTGAAYLTKSSDGGASWTAPTLIRQLVDLTGTYVGPAVGAEVTPAIDPSSGKLYAALFDAGLSGGKVVEVSLISSSDGGATWSSPVRLSASVGTLAFLPTLAVSSTGVVGATYYDERNATSASPNTADYWFTSSTDGGAHFGNEQHLAGPFDLGGAPFIGQNVPYLGAYQGLTAVGARFQAAFVGINANNASNPTDIMTASISP